MARPPRHQGGLLASAPVLPASLSLLHNHSIAVMGIRGMCAEETHTSQPALTLSTPLSMPCHMQLILASMHSPAKNMDRPPVRCLAAFLPLEVLPALLRSLLEVVPGVTALPRDGAAAAGVLGARLNPCRHHMTEQGEDTDPQLCARSSSS